MTPVIEGFVRFCMVGLIGFAIDGGLLYLLLVNQFDPYLARALSFPVAVTVTWYLNRHWAFGIRSNIAGKGRDYRRYILVQVLGALGNYLIYGLILIFIQHSAFNVLAALALGALFGLVINYSGSRWWAFRNSLPAGQAG